jgi:hypothetical protein
MKKLFILLAGAFIMASCSTSSDEPYCYTSTGSASLAVTGPETGQVNQQLVYNVSFKIFNTCGEFDSFAESTGFPKNIVAKVNYEGCNCRAEETTVTKQYNFTATASGTYVLKFATNDVNTPITKTVVISQ